VWSPASSVTWTRACSAADLVEETPLGVVVDGVPVCLVRTGGEVFAVHNECTHEAVRLSEGDVADGVIECWRHGSCFDWTPSCSPWSPRNVLGGQRT
jgi:3-phenylpropionate/trans-cinnamate dioxygenase ferredoxin subunit